MKTAGNTAGEIVPAATSITTNTASAATCLPELGTATATLVTAREQMGGVRE
jgi:hypothetical protein